MYIMTPMMISGTSPTGKQQQPPPKFGKNREYDILGMYVRARISARTGIVKMDLPSMALYKT